MSNQDESELDKDPDYKDWWDDKNIPKEDKVRW